MSTATRTPRAYVLRTGVNWLFRDAKERRPALRAHIKNGDYFGTLATTLGLLADGMEDARGKNEIPASLVRDILRRTSKDLEWLQTEYKIEKE